VRFPQLGASIEKLSHCDEQCLLARVALGNLSASANKSAEQPTNSVEFISWSSDDILKCLRCTIVIGFIMAEEARS
jgi:hypothetical protein